MAVIAVGLAVWGLIRTPSATSASSGSSGMESAEAKGSICTAFDIVRRGVSVNTNLQLPGGPEDVTGVMAVAANARVSLYEGGQYLLPVWIRRHSPTWQTLFVSSATT